MDKVYIKKEHLKLLQDFFKEYCPLATVWAYGSRLDNTAHSGSDLDLALSSLDNNPLGIGELREMIKEVNIPYFVDIFELSKLPISFQEEIEKKKVELFPCFNGKCGVEDE